ncbi:MAG: hypothetical protein E6G79_14350 [Alphaproteobacteria bacterium]|nr:MAG: hypothetical protein E6G79_14350 [Alphaproteobacteria bacterium]
MESASRRNPRHGIVCPPPRNRLSITPVPARIGREGLDLLHQPGNVAIEVVVRDRGRHLPEMATVQDELSEEGRLYRVVLERGGRGRQVRKRRRVEDCPHPDIALRDVDDVAMNIVDRTPDILAEIGV